MRTIRIIIYIFINVHSNERRKEHVTFFFPPGVVSVLLAAVPSTIPLDPTTHAPVVALDVSAHSAILDSTEFLRTACAARATV